MDLAQLIMDYPLLSLLVVLPLVGFAALLKVGLVLMTGRQPPPDVQPRPEAEQPEPGA